MDYRKLLKAYMAKVYAYEGEFFNVGPPAEDAILDELAKEIRDDEQSAPGLTTKEKKAFRKRYGFPPAR